MEQRKEQSQRQNPPTLMRCPRCSSLDTKFDYFNNHSLAQPRHHCRTCKRRWTVGGKLRSIPVGGSSRSISKQVKAPSSRSSSLGAQTSQSMFTIEEECLQYAQTLPPTEARVHQDFDAAMTQPVTNLPEVSELPCPNSEVINQHVAYGSHSNSDGGNMGILEEWNIPDPPQQLLPEHTPIHNSPYQPHNQANTAPHYDLYYTSLVQPGQPENSSSQEVPNDFNSFTSGPSLRNYFIGSLTHPEEDTFFVNIDDWLNNPDEDTSSVNVDEWLNDPEEDISSVNVDEWLNLSDHRTP